MEMKVLALVALAVVTVALPVSSTTGSLDIRDVRVNPLEPYPIYQDSKRDDEQLAAREEDDKHKMLLYVPQPTKVPTGVKRDEDPRIFIREPSATYQDNKREEDDKHKMLLYVPHPTEEPSPTSQKRKREENDKHKMLLYVPHPTEEPSSTFQNSNSKREEDDKHKMLLYVTDPHPSNKPQ